MRTICNRARIAHAPRKLLPSIENADRRPAGAGLHIVRSEEADVMKSDPQVIQHLNAQLKNELTAINQYFLHHRMLKHWGFDRLAQKEYEESIGEMKHADKLMERLFVLGGLPNLQDLGKLLVGENVPEILDCDLQAETGAQATIKDGIAHCESVRDYVSRDLLQTILDDTEEHIDFLETQLELIGKVGRENYLQSQMGGGGS
jgi:bacterioferritin